MKYFLLVTMILISSESLCEDREISLLTLYTPESASQIEAMKASNELLQQVWANSGLNPAATLRDVAGRPLPLKQNLSHDPDQALEQAINQVLGFRSTYSADIVIVYTNPNNTYCGKAGVRHWLKPGPNGGDFVVTHPPGLDLRGRNDTSFIAVVNATCASDTATHEFGHLLGGGHPELSDTSPLKKRGQVL